MRYQKKTLHKQARLPLFIFGLLVQIVFSSNLFADSSNELLPPAITPTLALTADEQAWLAQHPSITMGSGIFPPLNSIDEQGKSVGMGPDYLALVAARLGITINMISGDWTEMQASVKAHKLDGLSIFLKNSERQAYFDFAGPYTQLQYAILVNKDTQEIAKLDDLAHKRVGTMTSAYSENFLKKNHPDIDLFLYKSYEDAVHALINREIEAVVGSLPTLTYFIDKQLITGLKVAGLPETMGTDVYAAVRKDWPQLSVILNKAFTSISAQEHQKIRRKWIGLYPVADKTPKLALTVKQKEWLAQQEKVRVRVFDLPPYMIVQAGHTPEGIAIDYLNLIAQRTGIKLSYDVSELPFSELLENMKQGQGADLIPLIVNRRERQAYMLFSDNYIESPTVIATRNNSNFVFNIQELSGKLVGVLKAGNVQKLLSAHYPNIKLALYNSNELALKALANGHIDAFVGSLTTAAYIIQKRGFSNIHIVASSALGSEYYAIGSRQDWPELAAIINLALASMSEKEKTAIRNKYVTLNYQVQGIVLGEVLMWIFTVICIALLIVLVFITWNRSLRQLVNSRTAALQREVSVREKANKSLLKSQRKLLKAQKIANLGHWKWDLSNDTFHCSDEMYRILGILVGTRVNYQALLDCVHPDDHNYFINATSTLLKSGHNDRYHYRIIQRGGRVRHVSTANSVTLECDEAGSPTWMFGFLLDITELKESEHKLLNYQQRLKSLASQLALVEEQERRSIAADLHDNVGQSLALTRLQLAAVLKRLPDDTKTAELVRHSSQLILTVIQETRHLIFEISSPSLNELGLAAAITEWVVQSCEKNHGLKVEVMDRLKEDIIAIDLRAILFRNIRELLVNVIKHAKATAVVVILEEKSGHYIFTVKDDGIGFRVEERAENVSADGRFGLFSIQERMMDLGGQLRINSKPKKGCTVVMKLPTTKMDKVINAK